jgi:hypothetical protein
MKVVGIILTVLGIGLFIFQGIRTAEKEKILDVGPVEISKKVQRSDSWQLYAAGGIAIVVGIILAVAVRKKVAT